MLKSEWKELPNHTHADDYAFMKGVKPEVWAWELLRRKKEYRDDWDYFEALVKKAKATAGEQWRSCPLVMRYEPAKLDESEPDDVWLARIALEDGPEPVKETVNEHLARRWGVMYMAPYDQPHSSYVTFRPDARACPKLVRSEDSFMLLTEELGSEQGEIVVTAVRSDIALVAFDLTTHLGPQIEKAKELLDRQYEDMKKSRSIKRGSMSKQITEHLVRHLQVLDARRANPKISAADIARALGYDEEAGGKTASQQGCRWLQQAEAARDGYQDFLMAAGVPPETG